ncbi:MAG: hypothetical protein WCE44_02945 [Candidatus Velthaea sp.]|jgi:hypothetical protein
MKLWHWIVVAVAVLTILAMVSWAIDPRVFFRHGPGPRAVHRTSS